MSAAIFQRGQTPAFLGWLTANQNGYVTNWLLNGKLIVLHTATCGTLQVKNIKGQKVCSESKTVLDNWCRSRFGRKPDACCVCDP